PLDRVSTSMTINATAAVLLAMYVVVGEEQGVPRAKLEGTVQNDILKEFIARGTYIYPIEPSLRLVTDVCRFVAAEGMSFNPISVSGYHMREAGRPRSRSWRSRSPMGSNTCGARWRRVWRRTSSCPGFRFSSPRSPTCLKKSP